MPRIVIVGAGISGLCTAHYLVKTLSTAGREAEIVLFEAEKVPGGKMRTIREDGFNLEWGPNGFLTNKPYSLELVKELGIEDRLARSSDLARKRFIYSDGRLHRLPETPQAFLASNLLSLRGRLRILWEPFAPGPPPGVDESLGDFARRRLGAEALEKLLDPMVTGIFAGDPDKMSLRSCFPLIHDLERKHGGLVKGMISLQWERRRAGEKREMSAGPGGVLMSFDAGVQALTDVLAKLLSEGLHTGVSVESVRHRDGKFLLSLVENGGRGEIDTDVLVLATPAYSAAAVLVRLDPRISEALAAIPYSPISVVALGYDQATLGHPLDGFGFLIPRLEKRKILGALWDSSVFPNRAPAGKALIRAMVGGVRNPELAALPAEKLIDLTRKELTATMGIAVAPVLARAFFHDKGIPQYLVGHGKVLERIKTRLAAYPGLYLNSNAYRGIALNDCVLQSRLTAERIAKELYPSV
ncbi:MAG: protoporphyrinogen oxidase [Deltaproteobacteria bacterium RBG_16_64_85]|nr:MAG: protoporphyrinogen oxidase [Deltaproteobacteria bacterium RBG_16_64_85]